MPLDTGATSDLRANDVHAGVVDRLRPIQLDLSPEGTLGAALRRARETLGLEPSDIAQATRIRAPLIIALENDAFDALPPTPFVFGFASAYARALGVDPATATRRLRAELRPGPAELQDPPGLRHEERRRSGRWLTLVVAALLVAMGGWNIARRLAAAPPPPPPAKGLAAPSPPVIPRTARLGAPLPAPAEADAPPLYATPGVDPTAFGAPPATPEALAAQEAGPGPAAGAPFQPGGVIYGDPGDAGSPSVLLQARKATTIVVRDDRGAVVFARQLAAGEAWRAPPAGDLAVDVGNPASVERFVDGRSRGLLSAPRSRLADLRG